MAMVFWVFIELNHRPSPTGPSSVDALSHFTVVSIAAAE